MKNLIAIGVLLTALQVQTGFCFSQKLYKSEIVSGDIYFNGYSSFNVPQPFKFPLNQTEKDNIQSAHIFLLLSRLNLDTAYFDLDNQRFHLDSSMIISQFVMDLNQYERPWSVMSIDIKNALKQSFNDTVGFTVLPSMGKSKYLDNLLRTAMVYISYEDTNSTVNHSVDLYFQNKTITNFETFEVTPINPVEDSILLSLNGYFGTNNNGFDNDLYIDGIHLGNLNQNDPFTSNVFSGAVIGSFKVENNVIYGIGGDTFDNQINGHDAVYKFLNTGITSLQIKTSPYDPVSCRIPALICLTYPTNCDSRAAELLEYKACLGDTIEINNFDMNDSYQWNPSTGLSCSACYNPSIFCDSTMTYSVLIKDSNNCSVVQPVAVQIKQPKRKNISVNDGFCGQNDGEIIIAQSSNTSDYYGYSFMGEPLIVTNENTVVHSSLSAGVYSLQIVTDSICYFDTLLNINPINNVQAAIVANPISGFAPLEVNFTNAGENYTNHYWLINSTQLEGEDLSYTFYDSGDYNVMLVNWNQDSTCSDTAFVQIDVLNELKIVIPNVFTPNGDGTNDQFSLVSNLDVEIEYTIQNRWGETIKTNQIELKKDSPTELWAGDLSTEGVYFYRINVLSKEFDELDFSGFVHLEK